MIPIEAVKALLPSAIRKEVTQELLDKIEASVDDPLILDAFKENFVSYIGVLTTGKYKMTDYVNAVKYVSYKLLGYPNRKAYIATFPERYRSIYDSGNGHNLDSWVTAYNRGKLVNAIYEQTMIPTHILNAPLFQEALNALADVVRDPDTRPMTKVKACEAILAYTKPPEVAKAELTIGIKQSDTLSDLRETTEQLAGLYKTMLEKGCKSLKDVAEAEIINTEYKVVEKEEENE